MNPFPRCFSLLMLVLALLFGAAPALIYGALCALALRFVGLEWENENDI